MHSPQMKQVLSANLKKADFLIMEMESSLLDKRNCFGSVLFHISKLFSFIFHLIFLTVIFRLDCILFADSLDSNNIQYVSVLQKEKILDEMGNTANNLKLL